MDNVQRPQKLFGNGENVSPDLKRQLFRLSPTVVDGGDPMRKLKLVKEEEEAVMKNICSLAEGRVNEVGSGGGGVLSQCICCRDGGPGGAWEAGPGLSWGTACLR